MSVSGFRAWQRGCARLLDAILLTHAMAPLGFANTPRPSIDGRGKELESLAAFSADVRRSCATRSRSSSIRACFAVQKGHWPAAPAMRWIMGSLP